MKIYDVIIIGAGPAGISCAIQFTRYGIEFLIFEKKRIGGLLINANLIENYPGFPYGIKGRDIVKRLEKHLLTTGVKVEFSEVKECELEKDTFIVKTKNKEYFSKMVVLATGTLPKKIKLKGLENTPKKRILYEVYTISSIQGKTVTIIGGGDVAFDYALSLSRKNKVLILNRSKRIKALPLLIQRVKKENSIKYVENAIPYEVKFESEKILFTYLHNNKLLKLETEFLLIATGRKSNLEILSKNIINNKNKLMKTGKLYMIGDVGRDTYRQVAISCGDGVLCAMNIYRRLKGENHREDI